MSILKIPRRYQRLLREYRRVAHIDHGPCPMCNRHIQAGEEYDGYVYLTEAGIKVSKWHTFCPDDFWREMEEEEREIHARDNDGQHAELAVAA